MPQGTAPRNVKFGDRIKKLWRKAERPGAFILVGLAFVLQTIGLTPVLNQETAAAVASVLLSVGLIMIISLVSEIHSEVTSEDEGRQFLEFDKIKIEIRDRLKEVAKARSLNHTIDIKLIGLTLGNQWGVVESFLKQLAAESNEVGVQITIVQLDPTWDELEKLNKAMPQMAVALRTEIEKLCDDYRDHFQSERWKLHLHGLREFPLVAGILIDNSFLYRTLCDVEHGKRITQGTSLYEFFEYREPGEKYDHDTVEHFVRLFEYYTNRTKPLMPGAPQAV